MCFCGKLVGICGVIKYSHSLRTSSFGEEVSSSPLPKKVCTLVNIYKATKPKSKYDNKCMDKQNGSQKHTHRQTRSNRKWILSVILKTRSQKHPQGTNIILGEFNTNLLHGDRPPSNYQILWGIGDDFYIWKVFDGENKRAAGVVTGCDEYFNCLIYSSVDDLWSVNVRWKGCFENMKRGDC